MDQQMSVLFFILLVFKSFSQTTTTTTTQHHSSNYDITETLRNAIHVILQNFEEIIRYDVKPQYNSTGTYNLKLEKKTFSFNESDGRNYPCSTKNLYSNFIDNEIRITSGMCSRIGKGILTDLSDLKKADEIKYWYTTLGNISVEMSESSKNNSNEKLLIRDSFQEYQNVDSYGNSFRFFQYWTMSFHEQEHLKQLLKPILLRHIYNEFREYGKHIWKKLRHHTSTIFTSTHPNFFNDPQQYYYLLPNISYICFNLRKITIRGLTNFGLINKTLENRNHVETTLLIKNISGEMILDYGSEIEKPMKLSFVADDVFIRANLSDNCSNVEIQYYRVIKTGLNVSLTEQQSAIIIQYIESAIALSLMPSMKIHRTNDQLSKVYDMRCPLGKMMNEMMNKENWNSMKKVLNKWVPFDDDQVTTKNTVPNLITSSNKTDPYEYHISFQNITIKLISARNSNPKDIQCEFPNNFKIIHQINAAPEQKFHWNSNKGDGVDLSFHANFTSISFSQINTNSSSSNNSCEFQLNSDENTKVELASDKNTIENEGSILKKKIDTTLVSVAKKPFISNFKQLVCLPFKICSKTVKMIDDFFLHFIDEVLNKCSLRRDKINDK